MLLLEAGIRGAFVAETLASQTGLSPDSAGPAMSSPVAVKREP